MMGATPNKGLRYPDPAALGQGPDGFDTMAYDLDAAHSAEDANRELVIHKNRAKINNIGTGQSYTKNAYILATFTVVEYDNAGQVNLGLHNDRITATRAGLYVAYFMLRSLNGGATPWGTTGFIEVAVGKNGAAANGNNFFGHKSGGFDAVNTVFETIHVATMVYLAVNDYVQGYAYLQSAAAGPFTATNELSLHLVSG